jgi:hypothetical protein
VSWCVCMCTRVCVCVHTRSRVFFCLCLFACKCDLCVSACACLFVYMCICVCARLCVCLLVRAGVRVEVYVYMYAYVYVYLHARVWHTYTCRQIHKCVAYVQGIKPGEGSVAVIHYCCRLQGVQGPIVATSLLPGACDVPCITYGRVFHMSCSAVYAVFCLVYPTPIVAMC